MRTDPSDTGGLFVGRRPGTAPVRYDEPPQPGSRRRRRFDALLAHGVLALMVTVNLLFWGPIPAASLWVASQVEYHSGSVTFGITVGFGVLLAVLFGALALLKRLVRKTPDYWVVRQFNPERELKLPRAKWGTCHVVVGKYNAR